MQAAGLDVGTTGCKLVAYDDKGKYLGRLYREYPRSYSASGDEIDAGVLRDAVLELLREGAAKWPGIAAIGVTSFGETFAALDADDKPLARAMLYTDPRGEEQCEALTSKIGRGKLASITGLNPHPMYGLCKLMWLRDKKPEIFNQVKKVCMMQDLIVSFLTGNRQVDYSLATRTMAFDIRSLEYSDEIFDAAGIDKCLFSKPVPTGTSAGLIKKERAAETGLSSTCQFVSSGHDQVAAAIGSGVFESGLAVDGAGTVECVTPVFTGVPEGDAMRASNYAVVPYLEKDRYVCYAFSYTGGAVVKWFTDNLAGYAAQEAVKKGISLFAELEGGPARNSPTGILVLPHFAGAATPYMDYGSKGARVGLTLATTQKDLHTAVMEGVCYEMRLNQERLAGAGIMFNALRATGGGANSREWMQMKADVLNVPVTSLATPEAGATGAAMCAAVAAGIYGSLDEAARSMITERERYEPRQSMHEQYEKVYQRYSRLYAAVRPLMEK
jgi:xylulokinase